MSILLEPVIGFRLALVFLPVMAGLVPAIHDLNAARSENVDARNIGERSDAVLSNGYGRHGARSATVAWLLVTCGFYAISF